MFRPLLLQIALVLILGVPVLAQSQDTPPQMPTAASSTTPSSANAPKKVWTNDNVPTDKNGVSVVGDKRNLKYHMSPLQPADPATVDRIKKSLQKLQGQVDEVNAKLKSYKQFEDGDPVSKGERDMSKGYSRTPVDQQIKSLLEKKKYLESQIGDLVDDARQRGIDPGLLR